MTESDVPVLDCDSLCVRYGDGSIGVAEVSLSVGKGEIVALLGPNGAGKSTTLRALSGVLPSERVRFENGTVRFAGREVGAWRPHQAVQAGVVLLAEREKVFADLTVEENLRAVNCRRARSRQVSERAYVYDLFPSLARRRDAKAGMLSGGERQMLAIGRAILLEPVVLLADEVSLGVTPAVSAQLMQIIATLRTDKGVSVLLVEQGVSAALAVADRAMVLERGRVVLSGTPSELMTDKGFVDRYLGIETAR
jgi:branched-chain amino acid transport system ATP-binding protein